MRLKIIMICVVASVVTGCVTGVEPPKPTTQIPIEGGEFYFGSEIPCINANQQAISCAANWRNMPKTYPRVKVDVADFKIDEHEVTNAQYAYCVEMGACTYPVYTTVNGKDYYGVPDFDKFPVVNITAKMAEEYCEFVERRLPTEVEWERAAGGKGAVKRFYAGQNLSNADLTVDKIRECDEHPLDINISYCTNKGTPMEVMTSTDDFVLEDGLGIWDMAGNVSEWTAGRYREGITCADKLPDSCDCWSCSETNTECKRDCYATCDACTATNDCFKLCSDVSWVNALPVCIRYNSTIDDAQLVDEADDLGERVFKGGDYLVKNTGTCKVSVSYRGAQLPPDSSAPHIGFRCVSDGR